LLESLETVAIALLGELHLADTNVSVVLPVKVPIAVRLSNPPSGTHGLLGVMAMETSPLGVRVVGWYSSEVLRTAPPLVNPPAARTVPLFSRMAEWLYLAVFRLPVAANVPVAGLKSSALWSAVVFAPPATRTNPSVNSVAV
jgi:hypothetical protein